ncbi:MAG TPA: iron chelate uptake ABC transporter family permease subunit [Arachnia sp.]|nr:iron chelate uptake ABC transporter family permease subunit [Arachnia sp.]HMT85575.1 iron chelate uptake ABC transporter family permease subunit [Arachnia sp.]
MTTDTGTLPPATASQDGAPSRAQRVDFGHRVLVLRRGGFALRWQTRSLLVCAVLAVLTFTVTVWALATGSYPLSPLDVLLALIDHPDAGFGRIVVVQWRLPRALAAVVFGAALGVSGAVFQSLTRNPLASPDIIGFSTGSHTGALIVIIALGGNYLQVAAGALVGGVATAAVVYLLAWQRGVRGFRLIIIGIGVAAMLGSVNTWLLLKAELEVALSAAAWGIGTLSGITWPTTLVAGAVIVVLLLALSTLGPSLRQLELGDDAAKATGVRAEPIRLTAIVTGIALIATVTAAAGPISFVALAAPQIARRLARTPGVTLAPAAAMGALMLATADHIAQNLLPQSVPVGVVTVVIGGSYLVWVIVAEVRRRSRT